MGEAVESIVFGWDDHPDSRFADVDGVRAPLVSARLSVHDPHIFFRADLNPSAAYTVFPLAASFEIDGLVAHDLEEVRDPVLRHLRLRLWRGRQKVEVFGGDLGRHLALRLRVAFDVSGTSGHAILGQDFFQAARVTLDPTGDCMAARA